MPRLQTMGEWVTCFQEAADLENDDSITPAKWKRGATLVYGEMWSEITNGGGRYFETSTTIAADGSASYAEPSGHFSTVRVVRVESDGRETPLRELRQQDEAAFKGLTGDAVGYTHVDDQLFLYPAPSSGTYKWYYFQQPTDIRNYADDDVVDVMCPAGEAFFIWGTVAYGLHKQSKGLQFALDQKERARELLQIWAAQRNWYEPHQKLADDRDDDSYGRTPGDWEPWR